MELSTPYLPPECIVLGIGFMGPSMNQTSPKNANGENMDMSDEYKI